MKILFIGAGRMAEAMIAGIQKLATSQIDITVTNHSDQNRLLELKNKYQVHIASNWQQEVEANDVIISAAPPSAHGEIFKELSHRIHGQLVITVAAGVDTTMMETALPSGTPVCWIMPNTAAQIQASISTFVCGKSVTEKERKWIEMILTSIGAYEELTEEQVHDLTAITGSAPAFLYYFCEALEEAATSYGITKDQARKLVTKMVAGSAKMLEAGNAPDDLRDQVTTPGGSTEAGIATLKNGNFQILLQEAIRSTNDHARNRKN